MSPAPKPDIPALLRQASSGDPSAEREILAAIYPQLKRLASLSLRAERSGHPLQATVLANEAWLRLVGGAAANCENYPHFLAVASRVMRRILVDYARANVFRPGMETQVLPPAASCDFEGAGGKRGGGPPAAPPDDGPDFVDDDGPERLLAIVAALEKLEKRNPRQGKIVEMRFFGGLTEEEIGQVLGISTRTVKRDWVLARAWLYAQLPH